MCSESELKRLQGGEAKNSKQMELGIVFFNYNLFWLFSSDCSYFCVLLLLFLSFFLSFLWFFVFIVVIFCYVSFIVSEVKLFVRHTLCIFPTVWAHRSSPIACWWAHNDSLYLYFVSNKFLFKPTTISGLFNRNGIYSNFIRVFLLLGTGDAEIKVPMAELLKVLYIYKICSAFFP